jgi:hypothetical protein
MKHDLDLTDEIADLDVPIRSVFVHRGLREDDVTDLLGNEVPLRPVPLSVRLRTRNLREAKDSLPKWFGEILDELDGAERTELLAWWTGLVQSLGGLQGLLAAIRRRHAASVAARGD